MNESYVNVVCLEEVLEVCRLGEWTECQMHRLGECVVINWVDERIDENVSDGLAILNK